MDKGDTLEGLAQMYHLPYEKLLAANKGAAQDVTVLHLCNCPCSNWVGAELPHWDHSARLMLSSAAA